VTIPITIKDFLHSFQDYVAEEDAQIQVWYEFMEVQIVNKIVIVYSLDP